MTSFKYPILLLCGLLLAGCTHQQAVVSPVSRPSALVYRHGVNISHYISQLGSRNYASPGQFSQRDMEWIARRGYDHIRLPIDGPLLINDDGSIRWERLEAVDQVLRWAKTHGIDVILDMHKLPGTSFSGNIDARLFENEQMQATAIRLWQGIAVRYKEVGPELRFEILNEPVSDDAELVTAFYARVLAAIREISPERKVLVCSNRWGQFGTVRHLEPLLDDPNVVVAVHFYEPHIFTHQKASWTGAGHPDFPDVPFPGIVPDIRPYVAADHYGVDDIGSRLTEESVREEFRHLAEWMNGQQVEVHLGEFGVYHKADDQSKRNWYRLVLEECEKYGIGWAVWDYKGGFAVRSPRTGEPTLVQEVIDPFLNR